MAMSSIGRWANMTISCTVSVSTIRPKPAGHPEERYVAAYRQRETGRAGGTDKAADNANQAKTDASTNRVSNMLYRTGSEAGRALQFQQVIIGEGSM